MLESAFVLGLVLAICFEEILENITKVIKNGILFIRKYK